MKIFVHDDFRQAAVCRGYLANSIREIYRVSRIKEELSKIYEKEIPYSIEDLEPGKNHWDDSVTIWRDNSSGEFTLTPKMTALPYEDSEKYTRFSIISLEQSIVPDYMKEDYEYTCYFSRGDDGRLSGRINYRSDTDGCFDKLVFPDRSWKDTVAGYCRVKIVKDLPGYAFVKGTYATEGSPAEIEDVIQKLWDDVKNGILNPKTTIFGVENSLAGTFTGFLDHYGYNAFVIENETGRVCHEAVCPDHRKELAANLESHIVWKRSAEDTIMQYTFNQSADELFARFKLSKFSGDDKSGSRVVGYWREENTFEVNAPTVAIEAFDLGILTRKTLLSYGVNASVIKVNRGNVFLLAGFDNDELEELIRYVNQTNENADDRIRGAARKGKIAI